MAPPPVERLTAHAELAPFLQFPLAKPKQLAIARQVFMELAYVQRWESVKPYFCEPLEVVYLVGRAVKSKPREFILPSARDEVFSMETLARYFDLLAAGHQDEESSGGQVDVQRSDTSSGSGSSGAAVDDDESGLDLVRDAIVVAIVDSDSTCAMYRMFRGLRPPPASAIVAAGDADDAA